MNATKVEIIEFVGSALPEPLLILLIGLLLVSVSYYIRNWALMILSGILFFIMAFYDVFAMLNNSLEFLFFISAGLVIIYQGISYFADERKESISNDRKR